MRPRSPGSSPTTPSRSCRPCCSLPLGGAIVATVIGLALTRMRENAMAMATIGVLVILFVVFDNWEGITRGATGLFGIPRSHDGLVGARLRRRDDRHLPVLPRVERRPRVAREPHRLTRGGGARLERRAPALVGLDALRRAHGDGRRSLGAVQHRVRAAAVLLLDHLRPARDARRGRSRLRVRCGHRRRSWSRRCSRSCGASRTRSTCPGSPRSSSRS